MNKPKTEFWILCLLLGLVSFYFLIWDIGKKPLALWDESRQAMNAYEMYKSGDFSQPTYHNERDFWNTKPHLLVALQAAGSSVSGPSLTALRMPSALAAWCSVMLIFVFLSRNISRYAGFSTGIIFLTCFGLTEEHVASTGDYDALLMFFTLCAGLTLFTYSQKPESPGKLYLFVLFVTLAFFTKGVAILLWVPAWIIWLGINKHLKQTLLNKHFWLGTSGFLSLVAVYYGYAEHQSPGFIKAAWGNEVTGRLLKPNEGHYQEWWFYLEELFKHAFAYWWLIIPAGLTAWTSKDKKIQLLALWAFVSAFVFLVFLSIAKTRIYWYMAPVYPFLAILCGLGLWGLVSRIFSASKIQYVKPLVLMVITAAISIGPFVNLYRQKTTVTLTHDYKIDLAITFRNIEKGKFEWPTGCKLISDNYEPILEYYQMIFTDRKKTIPTILPSRAHTGDTVCVINEDEAFIQQRFKTKVVLFGAVLQLL